MTGARSEKKRSTGRSPRKPICSLDRENVFSWLEAERFRLAGDLHRGIGQNLSALVFMMDDLLYRLSQLSLDRETAETSREIYQSIQSTVVQCEALARVLVPGALEGARLPEALGNLALIMSRRLGVPCTLRCQQSFAVPSQLMVLHLYRLIQDLIDYESRFQSAKKIDIRLQPKLGYFVITVNSVKSTAPTLASDSEVEALSLLELRVQHLGGKISEVNGPKKRQVTISLPRPPLSPHHNISQPSPC